MPFADFSPGGDPLVDLLGPEVYTRQVLIDLARSPIVDSSGVGWLIGANKRFKEKDRVRFSSFIRLIANWLR